MAGPEHTDEQFERALGTLDVSLFDHVRSQTAPRDRLALLALQNACREVYGTFRYLEIGSHRGGSLQVLIRDPRCVEIVSIDARPAVVPDDLQGPVEYRGNTTARMLDHLRAVPGADLAKLRTFDASTADLDGVGDFRPQLCFVDGEHTHEAALRDARFCLRVMGDGAIAFHDCGVVESAIEEFLGDLEPGTYSSFELPRSIQIVEVGEERLGPRVRELVEAAAP
jgi:Methyltransferase domain